MKKQKSIISKEHLCHGLEALSAGMAPFVKKLLGNKGMAEIDLIANWKNIAGEETAQYSLPQKIEFKRGNENNGTLYLLVANGAYALDIQHKTPLLLEKINTFFGYCAVAKIKIIQDNSFIHTPSVAEFEDKQEKKLVTPEEETYIQGITENVKNPDLKARLKSLGESIFKNNK